MSDLVERLRNPQKFTSVVPWAVLDEAADTIQRLREALEMALAEYPKPSQTFYDTARAALSGEKEDGNLDISRDIPMAGVSPGEVPRGDQVTSSLVERLRAIDLLHMNGLSRALNYRETIDEAADTIQRLREALEMALAEYPKPSQTFYDTARSALSHAAPPET
jgi:hypothetical protein